MDFDGYVCDIKSHARIPATSILKNAELYNSAAAKQIAPKRSVWYSFAVMGRERFLRNFIVPHFWAKLCIVFIAIFLMGFFLSFLIAVNWGTDPYSFMNINIASRLGWTLGNWQLLLNAVMFILLVVFNRRLIGFGTLFNMVMIGYTADFFTWLWRQAGLYSVMEGSFVIRLCVFIGAMICFVLVAAVYMNADMGLSPYDGTITLISQRLPALPFFVLRMCYDFLAVAVGFFATFRTEQGTQGSMTGAVVMAVFLGPVITCVGKFMRKRIPVFNSEDVKTSPSEESEG